MASVQFAIAFRLGARKALRQGSINREQFKLVQSVMSEPVRQTTEYGAVNIMNAAEDFVTGQILNRADEFESESEEQEFMSFSILTLLAFIAANMDSIVVFIQKIIDMFNSD